MGTVINQGNIIREVEDIDAMLESLEVKVTVNKATVEKTSTTEEKEEEEDLSTQSTVSTITDELLDFEFGLITISEAAMRQANQEGKLKLVKNVYEDVKIGGKGNIYMEVLADGHPTNLVLLHIKENCYKIIPHFVNLIQDGNFDDYKFNPNKQNLDLVSILGREFKFCLCGDKNVVMTQFKSDMEMTITGACLERIISLMLNAGIMKDIPMEMEVHHKSWRSIAIHTPHYWRHTFTTRLVENKYHMKV